MDDGPGSLTRRSAFAALSLLAVPVILWLGRDLTFTWDECTWIGRGWDLLRPHNEHWSTVPLVVWKGWGALFGFGSYLPFHVLLLGVYAVMAAGVYALLGGLYALGAVALLWFLGSGADQLMWAVQIATVGAIALGVWAFWLIERGRYGWAAVLFTIAVASSGMALPLLAAAIVLGLLRKDREVAWLAVPVVIYGAWYLAFGVTTEPVNVLRVPGYVVGQVLGSTTALTGIPGLLVLVVFGWFAVRSRDPLILACMVGIVAEFAIIGLVRPEGAPRYQTTFAALALLAAGRVQWPSLMRPVGFLALAWALVANMWGLLAYQHEFALWLPGHSCAAMGL